VLGDQAQAEFDGRQRVVAGVCECAVQCELALCGLGGEKVESGGSMRWMAAGIEPHCAESWGGLARSERRC
jgi:hypothetical protein